MEALENKTLEGLDLQIVQLLRFGGRQSNSELSKELGVSEATVRRRIGALVDRGVLKFAAITDPRALGLQIDTWIGINTDVDKLLRIADELVKMTEVRYVGLAMGAFDIVVAALFPSIEEWLTFRTKRLATIDGIRRTETFQIAKVLKRTYDWLTPQAPVGTRGNGRPGDLAHANRGKEK